MNLVVILRIILGTIINIAGVHASANKNSCSLDQESWPNQCKTIIQIETDSYIDRYFLIRPLNLTADQYQNYNLSRVELDGCDVCSCDCRCRPGHSLPKIIHSSSDETEGEEERFQERLPENGCFQYIIETEDANRISCCILVPDRSEDVLLQENLESANNTFFDSYPKDLSGKLFQSTLGPASIAVMYSVFIIFPSMLIILLICICKKGLSRKKVLFTAPDGVDHVKDTSSVAPPESSAKNGSIFLMYATEGEVFQNVVNLLQNALETVTKNSVISLGIKNEYCAEICEGGLQWLLDKINGCEKVVVVSSEIASHLQCSNVKHIKRHPCTDLQKLFFSQLCLGIHFSSPLKLLHVRFENFSPIDTFPSVIYTLPTNLKSLLQNCTSHSFDHKHVEKLEEDLHKCIQCLSHYKQQNENYISNFISGHELRGSN